MTGGALPGRRLGEGGVALIVVLLLLALLLTIVGEFSQAMRIEAVTAANFRSGITETWLAEAAYQRALAEILPDALGHELDVDGILVFRRTRLGTPAVPERLDVRVEPGRLSYRLTDESARINLNRATRDVLDRLLQDLGAEKTDRDTIIDSIQDWRDPNEEHRLNGAESDYYLALPMPYRSKNGDFNSVDELLQVRGMTRELLYGRPDAPGLAEHLTVFGPGVTNMNTASPVVLRALGFAPAEVDFIVVAPALGQSDGDPWRRSGAADHRRAPRSSGSRHGRAARRHRAASSPQSSSVRPEPGRRRAEPGRRQAEPGRRRAEPGRAPAGIGQTPGGIGQTPAGTGQTPGLESGRRRLESGRRQLESGRRRPESGRRRAESGRRRAEPGRRRPESGRRRPEPGRRRSESARRRR